jgi:hypothetical protein
MFSNNKCLLVAGIFSLIVTLSGCSDDFLNENTVSIQTTDTYYATAEGYEDLVRSCYTLLRDIHQQRELVLSGTDIFTNMNWTDGAGDAFNTYDIRMNSSVDELQDLWDLLYREIYRTNTVISRQDRVENIDTGILAVRVAEAKFLRAFSYFYLVQQWGDIPMPIEEVVTSSREVVKVSASDVYDQIVSDLEEAESDLPVSSPDYGRATKGAAQFLLARVHLTRGWNFDNSLGGTQADFEKAREYADQVISQYPLATNYSDLFPQRSENPLFETFPVQDDQNPEIVFAVQFVDDPITNFGDPSNNDRLEGNDYHSIFGGSPDIVGSEGRTSAYNRFQAIHLATPTMYRLYDPTLDRRYHHNFVDVQHALVNVNNFVPNPANPSETINIIRGDSVLYFRPWNDPAPLSEKGLDVGGTKRYAVLNTDEYGDNVQTPFHSEDITPLMWKFWQPGIEYGDAFGTFDFALFRSAEAYLIAAEAILKGASNGNLGSADNYYNSIVDRALESDRGMTPLQALYPEDVASQETVPYRAAGNLTIEMVLDERARELMGEYCRWFDLKRTGKLIENTLLRNPIARRSGTMEEKHYLRPFPQAEIDRSVPRITNNPGY